MSLTDTALKALKPKDASYIVSDDRGLYVEVLPSGSIVWRYRYRLDGKREKLTLGKYPALTLKNARLKRDEAAHQVAMGQSPAKRKQQEKVAGAEDVTVADFAERFFKDIQSRDGKDMTMPRRYLEKDILPHIGSKPVRDISAEDVRSVIWRKKEHGFDAAAGQVRGLLKRMFDYALTCGLIQANPVMALPMRHVAARARHPGQTLRQQCVEPSAEVSLQGQEIPAFTIHDLRRTASTLLHEQGWPSDVVEKALNHTIGGVRGVYNRAEYAEQRREMLQAWSDYIDRLAPSGNLVIGAASA